MALGHFGHGHFGLGRFGLDISATDVSATENVEGGRFGHNHKFWAWNVCMRPPLAFCVAKMSGPKRPRPKCPWPKCPTFEGIGAVPQSSLA